MRLLRHLEIVVVEADRAEAEGDEEHDPDIGALRVGPEERRGEEAEEDHQPAHGGRALLGQKMRRGAVGADRLALALLQPQPRDDRRAEEQDEEQPRARCAERAEGQPVEKAEEARQVRPVGEPGQHRRLASGARTGEMVAQRGDERPHAAAVRTLDHGDVAGAQRRATSPASSPDRSAQAPRIGCGAAS